MYISRYNSRLVGDIRVSPRGHRLLQQQERLIQSIHLIVRLTLLFRRSPALALDVPARGTSVSSSPSTVDSVGLLCSLILSRSSVSEPPRQWCAFGTPVLGLSTTTAVVGLLLLNNPLLKESWLWIFADAELGRTCLLVGFGALAGVMIVQQ